MLKRFGVACAVLLSLVALSTAGKERNPSQEHASLYEAVIRYQAEKWERFSTKCVRIDGKDPDDKFLKRLSALRLKKGSACVGDPDLPPGSVILSSKIVTLGQSKAIVEGGMYCGGLCAEHGTFHVLREGKKWVVIRFDLEWVS